MQLTQIFSNPIPLLLLIVIMMFSIILHEVAHGVMAYHLGDPTAKLAGRLTLNPLVHIDPIGTVLLPLILLFSGSGMLFGWAKPVPFDLYNLRNPKKDAALISLAGPVTNLLIAIAASILLRLPYFGSIDIIQGILVIIVRFNLVLAFFNLIPIAPLDGFKIVGGLLNDRQSQEWYQLERYGIILFLVFVFFPIGSTTMAGIILGPLVTFASSILLK